MRNHYIDGWSVFGVKNFFNDHTLDIDSYSESHSFHFTENEANAAMAELEKNGHEYDSLYVGMDSQYDP